MNWKFGCLIAFVLIIGAPFVASHYLAPWGTLLFIAAEGIFLLWGAPRLVKFGVKRFAIKLFMSKSSVLRGAMVEIHRVELTQDPRMSPALPGEDYPITQKAAQAVHLASPIRQRFVVVECTITPRPSNGRMIFWDPDELLLVPFDAKIKMSHDPTADDDSAGVYECSVIDENGVENKEYDKLTGRARLRTIFKCPPSLLGRAKLRYFFETFGDVMLPS